MASFKSFNIGARDLGNQKSAIQLFTDREEPREAFERKLRAFYNADWRSFSCVLSYYGIGGVGKTWLKNHLRHILDNDPDCPRVLPEKTPAYHIAHDFEDKTASADKRVLLTRLRKQLGDANPAFKFYLFDTALLIFAKKRGIDITKDTSTSLILENNPWLNTAITGLGAMPVVGWASNLIQSLDSAAGMMRAEYQEREYKKKYGEKIDMICRSEADDILHDLHIFFAHDLKENMTGVADKPLVIFLDTYEKYVDTLTKDTLSLISDFWLRKDSDSLIKSVPGIMWVIMGREKLTWADDDEMMRSDLPERPLDSLSEDEKEELACEFLEQHLLGDLSEKDTLLYLRKVGLDDVELGKKIYSLTNGTPLLLDMCVKRYNDLKATKKVTIEDIGLNPDNLISRYLSNMVPHYNQLSHVLAILGRWDDEMAYKIIPKLSYITYFTKQDYNEYMTHSFVIHQGDATYYLHDSVRKACLAEAPEELIIDVNRQLAVYYEETLSELDQDLSLGDYLAQYIAAALSGNHSCKEAYSYWDRIAYYLGILESRGDYKNYLRCVATAYMQITDAYPGSDFHKLATGYYAEGLRKNGRMEEAFQLIKDFKSLENLPDISSDDFLILMNIVYMSYSSNGKYEEALPIIQFVSEKNSKIHGDDDSETLRALINLAAAYDNVGRLEEAISINEQIVKNRVAAGEQNHPDTLAAMNNWAISLDTVGRTKEALAIFENIVEIRRELQSTKHPDTLSAMNNMSLAYRKAGFEEKANSLLEEVLSTRMEVLGDMHPETLNTISSMAGIGEMDSKEGAKDATLSVQNKQIKESGTTSAQAAQSKIESIDSQENLTGDGLKQKDAESSESVSDKMQFKHKDTGLGKAAPVFEKRFASIGKKDNWGKTVSNSSSIGKLPSQNNTSDDNGNDNSAASVFSAFNISTDSSDDNKK